MSLVSIIVPIYNVSKYLNHCVQSIIGQTYENLEVLLVDDGSTDKCPQICDEWAYKDARIKVIHKHNGGVSDARNKGLSAATGEYICFIDADDYVSPFLIEKMVHNIKPEGIAVCCFQNVFQKEPVGIKSAAENTFTTSCKHIKDLTRNRDGLFCCGILFPRELIMSGEKTFFDTRLSNLEDAVWMGIVLTKVKRITFIDWDNPLYFYLVREGSATQQSIDTRWQASCWIKAQNAIEERKTRADRGNQYQQKRILREMSRHCMNNFYGECFSGALNLSEIKRLGGRPVLETLFYLAAFRMRGMLKRR